MKKWPLIVWTVVVFGLAVAPVGAQTPQAVPPPASVLPNAANIPLAKAPAPSNADLYELLYPEKNAVTVPKKARLIDKKKAEKQAIIEAERARAKQADPFFDALTKDQRAKAERLAKQRQKIRTQKGAERRATERELNRQQKEFLRSLDPAQKNILRQTLDERQARRDLMKLEQTKKIHPQFYRALTNPQPTPVPSGAFSLDNAAPQPKP